jgi:acetolactate decarboxylase
VFEQALWHLALFVDKFNIYMKGNTLLAYYCHILVHPSLNGLLLLKPMPRLLFLLLVLSLSACKSAPPAPYAPQVVGALKRIMHQGDLSARADLSTYANDETLYALGAMADLKGEIQIFAGQPYHSRTVADTVQIDRSFSVKATLLVSSRVSEWVSQEVPASIRSKADLEDYLLRAASAQGLDTDQPFPFLLSGQVQSIDWHVINWPEGDKEHSHEKHITSGAHGQLTDAEVEMLGFYSDAHHGIFTHHTTNMHIHFRQIEGGLAGHVDNLQLGLGMVLKLPAS